MINESHGILLELWSRIKSHIAPKERIEVADVFVTVFDEFGMIDESILSEELDREIRAAVRSRFSDIEEENNDDNEDEYGY